MLQGQKLVVLGVVAGTDMMEGDSGEVGRGDGGGVRPVRSITSHFTGVTAC